MSYAVCRMQKVKSAGLKGMQFHNQRERKSRTNDDIDHERTRENYDLKNDKNIDYNERVKEIIESQKTGTRKTRKDAVLVNELLVTSDRDFLSNFSFHLEWAPSNGKPWLGTVAVAPEAKEKGIGRAVIEEIAGRLRGEHKAMFSAVPLDRQEWILFLSQCGFEQLKLEKDDREKTYMIMVKPL
ncbi:plasmid recombination protein [Bacillus velezensis]|uniref:plasmid recombination protein n=1 Tax=Bacillus velezensis TaxID=492670 RepID=UPI002DDD0A90|nr:plasmid recombination protein [Bacillus velezensis]